MKNNSKHKKNKAIIITFTFVLLLLVGGYFLFTNSNHIFSISKASAYDTLSGIPDNGTNISNPNASTTELSLICTNGADDPTDTPPCTSLNGGCLFGGTYPNCTFISSTIGGNTAYLPMAASGLALTAGLAQTDANVSTARTKYLTALSDTKSIMTELNSIADAYNKIIEAAQKTRDATTGTTAPTSCTSSELINS